MSVARALRGKLLKINQSQNGTFRSAVAHLKKSAWRNGG
jgi:hypothetical protein